MSETKIQVLTNLKTDNVGRQMLPREHINSITGWPAEAATLSSTGDPTSTWNRNATFYIQLHALKLKPVVK